MKIKVEEVDALTGIRTLVEEEYVLSETQQKINNDIKKANTIYQKQQRLAELTKDLAQVQAGFIIDDLEQRKEEFRTLLNEIRVLQGKEPRQINN